MAYNPINLGPTTTANSQAVVLPSDQIAIPVTGPLTDTQLRATAVPVSGTVAITGVATSANQTNGTQQTKLTNGTITADIKTLGTQVVSTDNGIIVNAVMHGLTTGGGGGYVDVKVNPSGSLTVDASGSSGVGVTGPLTDTQLRATAVAVSLASLPALATGSNAIGSITNTSFASTQSGTWNVGLSTGSNVIGSISNTSFAATQATATSLKTAAENYQGGNAVSNTNPLYVTAIPTNANGYSVATGSIGNTKTDIGTANTAGIVAGWYFYNPNNSVAYVQVFNLQASAVTLGTTAPVYSIGVPALSAANLMSPTGITHSTAISIAVTTTRAGSTNVGSTVDYNIFYKQ